MEATLDIAAQTVAAPEARALRADARRNREKVLVAARAAMARDGLDAQMEEIARDAGVGVGTVYRHFPNKDELVDALANERFERLAEAASDALAESDPWQSFENFIRASARIQTEDRALSEVLVSRPETMYAAAERSDIRGFVEKLMSRAQDAGVIRPDAVPDDVPMLLCALAGTHSNPKMDPDRYVAIALDGLRSPGSSPLPAPAQGR
jgi:AcrR family transcriptional regulator